MNTHTCVRPGCGQQYQDNDVDAYYCPPCNKARKVIAAEVDAKLAGKPRKEVTPRFTAKDFVGKGRIFFNAKDVL